VTDAAPTTPLTPEDAQAMLASVPDWTLTGDALQRTFNAATFPEAIEFVQRVASLAQEVCHHPDILIRHKKVTHDAGGLTQRDFQLAGRIDRMNRPAS
jgi:4a-hydroxytetrahydrobiopterin dehydratase